jgi:hypothetical protein
MPTKLLDVNQVADLLNISKRTAEYWQASGRLPGFVRVYGNRRWRSDVLAKWIKNGCPEVCRSMQTESQAMTDSNESGECET